MTKITAVCVRAERLRKIKYSKATKAAVAMNGMKYAAEP